MPETRTEATFALCSQRVKVLRQVGLPGAEKWVTRQSKLSHMAMKISRG